MDYSPKSTAAFLLTALALMYACRSAEPLPADQLRLTVNQSGRLVSGVNVSVESIADSRCPIGVQCFLAGDVSVKALLSKGDSQTRVQLALGYFSANPNVKRTDSTGVTLDGATYKVILRDVMPYPKIGSSEPRQALIQVTQL